MFNHFKHKIQDQLNNQNIIQNRKKSMLLNETILWVVTCNIPKEARAIIIELCTVRYEFFHLAEEKKVHPFIII